MRRQDPAPQGEADALVDCGGGRVDDLGQLNFLRDGGGLPPTNDTTPGVARVPVSRRDRDPRGLAGDQGARVVRSPAMMKILRYLLGGFFLLSGVA